MEKNKGVSKISVRAAVAGCIIAVTVFLLLLDSAKMYRSTVTILVIPRSQVSAEQKDEIVHNIASLPTLLTFYDRMLRDNPTIKDSTAGLSQDKRKQAWNTFVNVQEPSKSNGSLIELSLLAKNQSDAQALSMKAARTLFSVTSGYYDVKNDIDLRIVDGPITTATVSGWYWFLFVSLLFGAGVVYLLQSVVFLGKKTVSGKREAFDSISNTLRNLGESFVKTKDKPESSLEDLYLSQDQKDAFNIPSETDRGQMETRGDMPIQAEMETPQWEYPNVPEMPARNASHIEAGGPVSHVLKSEAPANLPIAEDMFPSAAETIDIPSLPIQERGPHEIKHTEPTQEEIKSRLNQLLRGER
jgi:hypothetical protein